MKRGERGIDQCLVAKSADNKENKLDSPAGRIVTQHHQQLK